MYIFKFTIERNDDMNYNIHIISTLIDVLLGFGGGRI